MSVEDIIDGVETGAENVAGTVVQALSHVAVIGHAVSGVLSGILSALPINAAEKADLLAKVATVTDTVDNVNDAVAKFEVAPPVVEIKASDLTAAVDAFLSTPAFEAHIAALVAAEVAKANPPTAAEPS